jgi:hypothetical protein
MTQGKYLPDAAGAIAGVAFCLLLFLAIASFDPLTDATDAELVEFWSKSSNLRSDAISMYLMLASVPCFLVFLVTLRGRLSSAEGVDAPVSTLVLAGGICFAAAVLIAGSARGAIAQSVEFGDEPLPGPETLRTATVLSMTTFSLVAMPAAAFTLAAASWLIVRTGVMAAWVGWSGLGVAAVIAGATAFLVGPYALPLLFLWVTATSIELWRTRSHSVGAQREARQMTSAPGAGPA